MDSEQAWECCICYNLLLDPVVGACGHDFCKDCLCQWAEACSSEGRARIHCPQCRQVLADSLEGIEQLGVCVRMKQMLEKLYPDKLERRRKESRPAEGSWQAARSGVVAQRTAAQQQIRVGRARYLRARRTRRPPATSSNPSSLQGAFVTTFHQWPASAAAGGAQGPGQHQPSMLGMGAAVQPQHGFRFAVLPPSNHTGGAANGSMGDAAQRSHAATDLAAAGATAAAAAGAGTTRPVWATPEVVAFTMGWWEAPTKEMRRRRAARYNLRR